MSEFSGTGNLLMLKDIDTGVIESFEEKFVFYNGENGTTASGHYTFTPKEDKQDLVLKNSIMYRFDLPGIASIIQVHLYDEKIDILKTHIVYQKGQVNLQRQLMTQIQIQTNRMIEVCYKLIKDLKDFSSSLTAYNDDSMKLIKRPIYKSESKYAHETKFDLYGLYMINCVHGGMIRENYTSQSFFGWSNSNPIGCIFSRESEVELMVIRSAKRKPDKGIDDEYLEEYHVMTTDFLFYIDETIEGITHKKLAGNAKLNEPLSIYMTKISPDSLKHMYHSGSVLNYTFTKRDSPTQLSNTYGEIDVADLKIRKHNIIGDWKDTYEVDIVLRNRFGNYIKIGKLPNDKDEGMFKNQYIDTIKNLSDSTSQLNMDPNRKILEDDRYELEVFDTEVSSDSLYTSCMLYNSIDSCISLLPVIKCYLFTNVYIVHFKPG